MNSYYKMRIDLHDEWFDNKPEYLLWWGDLMRRAYWKPKTVMVGTTPVSLHRGQLIASIKDLANRWQRSKDMIINYIKVLEIKGLISKTTKNNISIITILDYDLDDDANNFADNPEYPQSPYRQRPNNKLNNIQADNLVDNQKRTGNLPIVTTSYLADNHDNSQPLYKQGNSKKIMESRTDNLPIIHPVVATNNLDDNLTDSYIVYTEERFNKSTSTTRVSGAKKYSLESTTGNDDKSSGNSSVISTLCGIRKLLSDQKSLLLLQRESGFTKDEVMLWIEKFGKKWELSEPTHDSYRHLVKHVQDTLNIKRRKNEKPEKLLVSNESSAKEIWNIIQADLCMQYPDGVSVLGKLNFFGFCGNDISLVAPSRDVKETVKEKYIALINEQFEKYSDSPIKVKCGTIKEQKNN